MKLNLSTISKPLACKDVSHVLNALKHVHVYFLKLHVYRKTYSSSRKFACKC